MPRTRVTLSHYGLTGIFACLLASCTADGHMNICGYSTKPNYDPGIRTVYVPIFLNTSMDRGLEFDLTRAVIREIEAKTTFKVTDCRANADTELIGKIVSTRKGVILMNQLGEVRDSEVGMGVELVWRDLRPGSTGTILSVDPKKEEVRIDDPLNPSKLPKTTPPSIVTPTADYIPELGGSRLAANAAMVNRTAIQIVSMMEKGW
jgi:Lipopolysaccharide-assembly